MNVRVASDSDKFIKIPAYSIEDRAQMIERADLDLKKAQDKVEHMKKMLVEAQRDIDKSKDMFEMASKDVKDMQAKISNAKSKLSRMDSGMRKPLDSSSRKIDSAANKT